MTGPVPGPQRPLRDRHGPAGLLGRDGALRRLDWVMLAAVAALVGLGAVLVYSATRTPLEAAGADPRGYLFRSAVTAGIGAVLAAGVALVDHRLLRAYAPLVYVASVVGLLVVLTPLGTTIRGQHSWLLLPGGISLQPSELAKVALVVGLAMLLSDPHDAEDVPRPADVAVALAAAAVPLALVLLQPDLGTALVLGCLVLGVVAVSGAPARWLLGLVGVAATGAGLALAGGLVKGYQLDRIACFLDPGQGLLGPCYNVHQAQITIGSGGVDGRGLFRGPQTQGGFVPEQHTDFIFTVAGEELGLLGAGAVVLLLGVVLWRAGRIAWAADDLFGRLLAVGVMCWFGFQSFENIGMSLGIMPVTGVPLPLVSYGGSAMVANLLAVGLLQNVHLSRRR